jgi:hypothetical protein
LLAPMRAISPAAKISGGARFEKSVQQDTAIECEAGLFGQRQTWSDPEPAELFDSSLRIRHARV